MQHLEQELKSGTVRLNLQPCDDLNRQAVSAIADESMSREEEIGSTQNWSMQLLQQVAEHGSRRKTKCPTRRRAIDANEQCKPLGRKILRVLRHVPEEVYLRMEPDGWVHVEQLGEVINHWCNCDTHWKTSTLQPLMHELGMADRVQFDRNWCRAAYGHSTQLYKPTTFAEPNEMLFHGTRAGYWQMIECFGLAPMRRRFVQLTTDFDYALQIASQEETPIVLQVLRAQAIAEGTRFLSTGSHVWLAEAIPAHLLQVWLPDQG